MRGVYALLWMRNGAGIDDDPHWNPNLALTKTASSADVNQAPGEKETGVISTHEC